MFSVFLHTSAFLATHWRTWRPSGSPLSLRHRFLTTRKRQRFWFGGRVRRSFMPATYATCTRPHIALWLERPVHRHTEDLAGPEASVSPLLSWEQDTVCFWPATFTVLDDNSLQCVHTAEVTTRQRSIFYFAARRTRRHDHPPTTSTQLILDACGPFWSWSGPWHPPPQPGMREGGVCIDCCCWSRKNHLSCGDYVNVYLGAWSSRCGGSHVCKFVSILLIDGLIGRLIDWLIWLIDRSEKHVWTVILAVDGLVKVYF